MESITPGQARRVAVAAQGLAVPRPGRPVGMRDLTATVGRLGQFQIDSVNVVQRAHYLPLFSRLGPYDPALLDRAAGTAPRRLFEYWGHAASFLDVSLQPLLRFRMEPAHREVWANVGRIAGEQPDLVRKVYEEVAARGPVSARQLEVEEVRDRSSWGWNWSAVKTVLEWLFTCGEVTAACRNSSFERIYDLPERVLPRAVWEQPTPTPAEAVRGLVARAARALGVASERSLADYFRTSLTLTRPAIRELVEEGLLRPVQLGREIGRPLYLWHEARVPRRVRARALLSPFDSMVFERERLHQLFGFFYRIEIYVPAERRVHGYYVYPFLLGDAFVARVDLKADRAAGVLRVNAAFAEPGHDVLEVATELADELALMAGWLGLSGVQVLPRGDLAAPLEHAVSRRVA
ncbi:winged helix-turn-helix domain-containing protein [uncultured Friedmanniella sp.]|uniref:winged helix-turn-helix domain-containing protein n=1 Tax=uncultured Friedmanniella sp. TaxID=335381 RepID=UPI0035CC537E